MVVDEASFASSSPTIVTGTSLVSMMFVDEMEELRKRFTMRAELLAALPPAMSPPPPPIRFDFVDFSCVGGGSVIGTLRDGSDDVVDSVEVVVVDVVGGVVLRLIHGGSGRFVVVVVVETMHERDVINRAGGD